MVDVQGYDNTCLYVRRLPNILSKEQVIDLLKHFGANSVSYMGSEGKMKHSAFATYPSPFEAERALKLLHQAPILGSILRVEYANKRDASTCRLEPPKSIAELSSKNKTTTTSNEVSDHLYPRTEPNTPSINCIASRLGINYEIDDNLFYKYPLPNETILRNIMHCLASVPKFYTQVLHLMNKMNLPPPFTELTVTPPIPHGATVDQTQFSSEESELESSEEDGRGTRHLNKMHGSGKRKRSLKPTQPGLDKKRLRAQLLQEKTITNQQATSATVSQAADSQQSKSADLSAVFDVHVERTKPLTLPSNVVLPSADSAAKPEGFIVTSDPFGKIEKPVTEVVPPQPAADKAYDDQQLLGVSDIHVLDQDFTLAKDSTGIRKERLDHAKTQANQSMTEAHHMSVNSEDESGDHVKPLPQLITAKELAEGRLPVVEHDKHPVLKKYVAGEPCPKLYIKNLAKQTTEQHLKFIFGRYVNWDDPDEVEVFHIRHMTEGRMKGQAFVTLPHTEAATAAVEECHSYVLNDKPMSVSFAKSAD